MLVALSRGLAGKSAEFVTIAHHLGLFKWGDQVLGSASDEAWLGQIRKISHLVTVTYFDESPASTSFPPDDERSASHGAQLRKRGELLVSEWSGPYENHGTSGYFQRLLNDEYLHAESQTSGRRSVMWSTEQPLDTFLKSISKLLPQPSRNEEARWLTAKDEQEGSTADLLVKGASREASVHLLQARFPGTIVIWRRPFRKLAASSQRHAEAAFLYDSDRSIDQSQVRAALIVTGSPVVRQVIETQPELLDDVLNIR
jgi:ribosomal protein L30/L7E